eukprot:TRINITY_DN3262_c0_g1_i1.p1 TRINITY_DN3262_c0_g1~~TRINITY_DN3262_c0_g1_i1.p1  ORF type:complete len:865 (-),score=159.79 TRINITY_DN3262_c0_g1_i1:76-2457(-)
MGVALVADVFMGAIEKITSKSKRVWSESRGKYVSYVVWNDTVANLTLMALGSSAPEILLGVIEIWGNNFYAGELGPSTIVGSAAFNLLIIIAVCVVAIPDGETRHIKDMNVYCITATFSVVAYIWLYLIVSTISENVVEIWEGLVTLALFPILVILAFLADIGWFSADDGHEADEQAAMKLADLTPEHVAALQMLHRKQHSQDDMTDEALAAVIQAKASGHLNRAHYRIGAIRNMTAGRRVSLLGAPPPQQNFSKVVPIMDAVTEHGECEFAQATIIVQLSATDFVVMENVGTVKIDVRVTLDGDFERTDTVKVDYCTRDGTAMAGSDYTALRGTLEFPPDVYSKSIEVKIVDDDAFEDDEEFFLDLSNPSASGGGCVVELGENKTACIHIVDDDDQGMLTFEKETVELQEDMRDKQFDITVQRRGGCAGKVSCDYRSEDMSAVAGVDFEALKGTLHFASGQASATFPVTIKAKGRYASEDKFDLFLSNVSGGARFDKNTLGGALSEKMTVVIRANPDNRERADRIAEMVKNNTEKAQLGSHSWREQFFNALHVNGGEDEGDDDEPPGAMAWAMHVITIFWKVLFALIPPADFCDGWLCFWISLVMIGFVTAFIADLAGLLGCCVGMPDSITAITLVALGTSLPDTFASKTAAQQDPYADASIGNVTGSNSVNVFLGIGLSWSIGAIYWAYVGKDPEWVRKYQGHHDIMMKYPDGGKLVVLGGDLGFSVAIFCICAVIAIGALFMRRVKFGGELGGEGPSKWATSVLLCVLWFFYISMSSWQSIASLRNNPCA